MIKCTCGRKWAGVCCESVFDDDSKPGRVFTVHKKEAGLKAVNSDDLIRGSGSA